MTVKVRFIIFPFLLLSNYSHQYVKLDALNAQMLREYAIIARKISPKMKMTKRSVIQRLLIQMREIRVRTDRTVLANDVNHVRRLARLAMVQRRSVPHVAPDYPSSEAVVSLWALMECVQELVG